MNTLLSQVRKTHLALVAALLTACGGGGSESAPVPVPPPLGEPVNQPPEANIENPLPGALFKGGEAIVFGGSATDPEDGALGDGRMSWRVERVQGASVETVVPETAGAGGGFTVPLRGVTPDTVYRIRLRATDAKGAVTEVSRDLSPAVAKVTLKAEPEGLGLKLKLDGQLVATPLEFTGVVGVERDLDVPDQTAGAEGYRFSAWSDGAAASRVLTTPTTDSAYVATLVVVPAPINQGPDVTVSVPAVVTVGVTNMVTVRVSDPEGGDVSVELRDDDVLFATATAVAGQPDMSFSWTPTAAGQRRIEVRGVDNLGSVSTTSVNVLVNPANVNQPPLVSLGPVTTAKVGTPFPLVATASDVDGQVVKVQFWDDLVMVGATSAPFTFQWAPGSAGEHTLRAVAIDDQGAQTSSTHVKVQVNPNGQETVPPTIGSVALFSQIGGCGDPGTVRTGTVQVADNVAVEIVRFRIDGVLVGQDTAAPFNVILPIHAYLPGGYTVQVEARDAAGNVAYRDFATGFFGCPAP